MEVKFVNNVAPPDYHRLGLCLEDVRIVAAWHIVAVASENGVVGVLHFGVQVCSERRDDFATLRTGCVR